jgi:CelD/BcsL family acetyltransferase involved in cellulose biosynthesis
MVVELIRPGTQLDDLQREWAALHQRTAPDNPFLCHAWLTHWMRHFATDAHHVLLQWRKGSLCGAFALELSGEVAQSLAGNTYWSSPLASDDASLREMCDALHDLGVRRIELRGPEDEAQAGMLSRALSGRYVAVPRHPSPSHAIAVAATLEGYLATRRSKVRAELSRKLRKMQRERPGVALRCWDEAPFGGEAFEIVSEVEAASWKSEEGTAILSSERETAFYQGLMRLQTSEIEPRLYALVDDGVTLAYTLGMVHRRSFYALKTSYPMALGQLSPGLVLFCKVLEVLGREGEIDRLEFLGQDSRFKQEMASDTRHFCTYHVERQTLASRSRRLLYEQVRPRALTLASHHPAARQAVAWLRAVRAQKT